MRDAAIIAATIAGAAAALYFVRADVRRLVAEKVAAEVASKIGAGGDRTAAKAKAAELAKRVGAATALGGAGAGLLVAMVSR